MKSIELRWNEHDKIIFLPSWKRKNENRFIIVAEKFTSKHNRLISHSFRRSSHSHLFPLTIYNHSIQTNQYTHTHTQKKLWFYLMLHDIMICRAYDCNFHVIFPTLIMWTKRNMKRKNFFIQILPQVKSAVWLWSASDKSLKIENVKERKSF